MRVEFFTKPQCPLCDDVREVLDEVRERVRFEVSEINILTDPALFSRFRYDIPVIALDGEVLFRYRVSAEALEAALRERGGTPVAQSPARR